MLSNFFLILNLRYGVGVSTSCYSYIHILKFGGHNVLNKNNITIQICGPDVYAMFIKYEIAHLCTLYSLTESVCKLPTFIVLIAFPGSNEQNRYYRCSFITYFIFCYFQNRQFFIFRVYLCIPLHKKCIV